jgi:ADP-heptose:LPS heptosyltransferase
VDARPLAKRPTQGLVVKILIVKFSAIGDCVMAGYAVNDLRQTYPDAEIYWVVDERCAGVVGKTSKRLAIPRGQWKKRGELRTLLEQYRWLIGLRKYDFDYGFDLQGHSKTAWCLRLSGAKTRLSARATDGFAKRLNPIYGSQPTEVHDVAWSREVVNSVLPIQSAGGEFLPGDPEPREANLVTICTGAGHPLKQIPVETLRETVKIFVRNGKRVVALGGPNDPTIDGAENLVGKTTLEESIAWIRKSECHIAGDTGTGHIAAAVGTPLVSVWGNMPLAKYRPYGERVTVLNKEGQPGLVSAEEIYMSVMGGVACVS